MGEILSLAEFTMHLSEQQVKERCKALKELARGPKEKRIKRSYGVETTFEERTRWKLKNIEKASEKMQQTIVYFLRAYETREYEIQEEIAATPTIIEEGAEERVILCLKGQKRLIQFSKDAEDNIDIRELEL